MAQWTTPYITRQTHPSHDSAQSYVVASLPGTNGLAMCPVTTQRLTADEIPQSYISPTVFGISGCNPASAMSPHTPLERSVKQRDPPRRCVLRCQNVPTGLTAYSRNKSDSLALCKMKVQVVARKIQVEPWVTSLAEIAGFLDESLTYTRSVISELRSPLFGGEW